MKDIEADVLALLDAGDLARAATAAIKGYGPQVLGYLTAVLRDDDEAADAFSVFCEDLWRGMASFRRESSVRTWAYRVAWHAAMRAARQPYRQRRRRLATSAASAIAAEVRSTTLTHMKQANVDKLAEVRKSLTAEEQTLLILRVDRELSWKDIAQVMAPLDEAALRKRFERLKEALRAKLGRA
jgi:RNA polymerase sigma-70 factor (ECF subfamily)